MKVHIEKGIYLESDDMQYIIKNYTGKVDKDGREAYTAIGYFSTLPSAINRLVKMKVTESSATTLQGLREDVLRIERYIHSKFEE